MLNDGELIFFLDRCYLSELPINLAFELKSNDLILKGDSQRVSFVGVIFMGDTVNIFLPRSSILPKDNKQKFHVASNIILAIEKYGRASSKTIIQQKDEGIGDKNLMKLSLLKNLLIDYSQNGIYSKRQSVLRRNRGKTNWKMTVNGFNPYPSQDGQPVYIDSYGVNREYYSECEIAKIHAQVIRKINEKISWLLMGGQRLEVWGLRDYRAPNGDIESQILQLRQEIAKTYSDRDIILLKMLIDFLENLSDLNQSNFVIGMTKFHFCWEAMLARVVEHVELVNSRLPFPVYITKEGTELPAIDSSMRTDIFMHDRTHKVIAVVDAKYYSATHANNSPRWKDIVKQLFYEKAVQTLLIDASIKNIFVFPGSVGNINHLVMKKRDSDSLVIGPFADEFKPIYCYYADPMEVVKSYIKNKKMAHLSAEILQLDYA